MHSVKPGGIIKWRKGSLKQQRNVQKLWFCPNSHPEGETMLFKVQYGWAIKVLKKKKKPDCTVVICFSSISRGCLEKAQLSGLFLLLCFWGWV